MNIRASMVTRASVLPVLLALSFNIFMASALALTGPEAVRALTDGSQGLNLLTAAEVDSIDPGGTASFTITVWNAGPGDAVDVVLHDDLPPGLAWDLELLNADADDDCGMASSQLPGGESQMSIDCSFGTLAPTTMSGGKVIRVFAETDSSDCGPLSNAAWAVASNTDRVAGEASMHVRCAEIGIGMTNDAAGTVLPGAEVSYGLTVTVSDGPAKTVVVVVALPDGLGYVSETASHGGQPGEGPNTVEWRLGELADGAYTLTYEAVVSGAAKGGDKLVNVASATSVNSQCPDLETLEPECQANSTVLVRAPTVVIDKPTDNTPEDDGRNNVPPTREGTLGGTQTPGPWLPDTAVGMDHGRQPNRVPVGLLIVFVVGSLGAVTLALAKVTLRNHLR